MRVSFALVLLTIGVLLAPAASAQPITVGDEDSPIYLSVGSDGRCGTYDRLVAGSGPNLYGPVVTLTIDTDCM